MTATIDIYIDTGGTAGNPGTSASAGTKLRFKQADNNNIDTNNTIPVPESGTNYSYWKQVYLYCSVAPDTQINNVKFYTDGTNNFGTGVSLKVGNETPTKNSGSSSGYDPATSAEAMTNHANITGTTDAFTYTSASPKSVSISESGSVIDAVGETSDYVVLQVEVDSTASNGATPEETLTFQYDEI